MREIVITTEFIRLQDLLKFAGLARTGGEAKALIRAGGALVNDEPCLQPGRKLRPGDRARFAGVELVVRHAG